MRWGARAAWLVGLLCACAPQVAGPATVRLDAVVAPDAAVFDAPSLDSGADADASGSADAPADAAADTTADWGADVQADAPGPQDTDAAPADAQEVGDANVPDDGQAPKDAVAPEDVQVQLDVTQSVDAAADATTDTAEDAPDTDQGDAGAPSDVPSEDVALFCATTAVCDDGNSCTIDTCLEPDQCQHGPVLAKTACNDGDGCTTKDYCADSTCQGAPVVCPPDSNACTVAKCEASKGCTQVAIAGPCDDKNPCTKLDACVSGSCVGGQALDCNDNDTCTDDVCVASLGCVHPLAAGCNDANSCTADSCTLAAGCAHEDLFEGAACEDGDSCTVWDFCSFAAADKLICLGGPAPTCDDGNVCTKDSCAAPGGCAHTANNGACDDFDPCTGPDLCAGDYCIGGLAKICADDGNACTVDYCVSMAPAGMPAGATVAADGCVHQGIAGVCSDGNPCTAGDVCVAAMCLPGTENGCDDKNGCTLDACLAAGACSHTPEGNAEPCDDASVCTSADTCDADTGDCVGIAENCSDSDPCTADVCDATLGCAHPPLCDDGDACTQDLCAAGSCSHTPLVLFKDDFSAGNVKGWTLDAEWEIGPAKQGPCGNLPPGDPAVDHSNSGDNMAVGVALGGIAKRENHGFRYLLSPAIDTTGLTYPAIEFWRWLQSDMSPYMVSTLDVFDGAKWHTIWHPAKEELVNDHAWTRVAYDISKYKSTTFRFRIGFSVADGDTVLAVGSWNIDDVTVGASWTCIENPLP